MSSYCDVVVIRHPKPGAVQVSFAYLVPTFLCKAGFFDGRGLKMTIEF